LSRLCVQSEITALVAPSWKVTILYSALFTGKLADFFVNDKRKNCGLTCGHPQYYLWLRSGVGESGA
jgi:hypothetical protein